jgi:flagellar biosynthesis protein FlhG
MSTIISVASGKGGVGKSVVAANLALLLSRRGLRVTLADLDIGGANLHVMFGVFTPPTSMTDFLTHQVKTLQDAAYPLDATNRLFLLAGTGDTLATANMPYARKKRLIRNLRELPSDIVVVDVGAGTGYHALDFFLMADIHLAVATPDPTSVIDVYRFIKLAAIRHVLSAFLARDAMTDALSDRDFSSVQEVLDTAGQTDAAGQTIAADALRHFRPCLVLNRMTSRSRINTLQLKKLLKDYIGGELTVLGEIPNDPAVEHSVRSYLPVVDTAPESPASVALATIADAILARIQLLERVTPQTAAPAPPIPAIP